MDQQRKHWKQQKRKHMKISEGDGNTEYGPGILIKLTGAEIATAIDAYLVSHGAYISGPRTIKVNDELCKSGQV